MSASLREARYGALNFAIWLPVAFLLFLALGALFRHLPWAAPSIYVVASLVSFAWYGSDKSKARHGEWRTPESTLHAVDLLGGWPGGLVAQRMFRHKNRKISFQIVFWFCTILHLALWIWIFLQVPPTSDPWRFLDHVAKSFASLAR